MGCLTGKKASKIRILVSLFKKYKKASHRKIFLSEEYYVFIHMKKTLLTKYQLCDSKYYYIYTIKEGYELKING